jgi:Cdc6-like AAA superfamily ATPase
MSDTILYPTTDEPDFSLKIFNKKEFNDTKIDKPDVIINQDDIERHADKLCSADFELATHQRFVKNFLSNQTPYNSLLLYHGLGTGKTCSAIGVSEEYREYMKQTDTSKKNNCFSE